VPADGKITHGTLGDERLTGQASTYGTMVAISRTDIINDDLGALTDVPRRLGRAAGQKLRRLFWSAFLASDGHFDVGAGNQVDGVLTDDGEDLQTALIAFRRMRSPAADGSRLLGGAHLRSAGVQGVAGGAELPGPEPEGSDGAEAGVIRAAAELRGGDGLQIPLRHLPGAGEDIARGLGGLLRGRFDLGELRLQLTEPSLQGVDGGVALGELAGLVDLDDEARQE